MIHRTPATIHPFESKGLGKAPFRYVESASGGSCCDYCGTHIVNQFVIESADAKRFIVGCECVKKTDDAGLMRPVAKALRNLAQRRQSAREHSPDQLARTECERLILAHARQLDALPGPQFKDGGATMLNWARLMLTMGPPQILLARLSQILAN